MKKSNKKQKEKKALISSKKQAKKSVKKINAGDTFEEDIPKAYRYKCKFCGEKFRYALSYLAHEQVCPKNPVVKWRKYGRNKYD